MVEKAMGNAEGRPNINIMDTFSQRRPIRDMTG
jgi:hypothetical protein